jgi:phosphatidate cytidylyltransferase
MFNNRLLTAMILGGAFIGSLFFLPNLAWALFLLVFILVGAWEWGGLVGYPSGGKLVFLLATAAFAVLLLPGMPGMALWNTRLSALLLLNATLFWAVLMPLWLAHRWRIGGWIAPALVGWLLLLSPWIALLNLRHISPQLVLVVMLTVALADSAAYFSGKRFGKHKLAPQISPGKTWEGLLGALIAVTLFAGTLCIWKNFSLWLVVGFLAIAILSVMGDLFESLMKRHAGWKDSGSILPGHGGVLDRIDGLTSTLPLVAFYVYLPFYRDVLVNL